MKAWTNIFVLNKCHSWVLRESAELLKTNLQHAMHNFYWYIIEFYFTSDPFSSFRNEKRTNERSRAQQKMFKCFFLFFSGRKYMYKYICIQQRSGDRRGGWLQSIRVDVVGIVLKMWERRDCIVEPSVDVVPRRTNTQSIFFPFFFFLLHSFMWYFALSTRHRCYMWGKATLILEPTEQSGFCTNSNRVESAREKIPIFCMDFCCVSSSFREHTQYSGVYEQQQQRMLYEWTNERRRVKKRKKKNRVDNEEQKQQSKMLWATDDDDEEKNIHSEQWIYSQDICISVYIESRQMKRAPTAANWTSPRRWYLNISSLFAHESTKLRTIDSFGGEVKLFFLHYGCFFLYFETYKNNIKHWFDSKSDCYCWIRKNYIGAKMRLDRRFSLFRRLWVRRVVGWSLVVSHITKNSFEYMRIHRWMLSDEYWSTADSKLGIRFQF